MSKSSESKAWRDIWSAGHGVGAIKKVDTAAGIIKTIRKRVSGVLEEIDRAGGKIKRNYIEMI